MNIRIYYQDWASEDIYEITNAASALNISTFMYGQPTKITMVLRLEDTMIVRNGGCLDIKVEDKDYIKAFIFEIKVDSAGTMQIEAYDRLRYLKFKDCYITKSYDTLSTVFANICSRAGLEYRLVDAPTTPLPVKIHDNKTMYEIIDDAITRTLLDTGKLYVIRDNVGVLELIDLTRLKTNWVIGENMNVTEYQYNVSINQETYNVVKIAQENQSSAKRENYFVYDSSNIKKWGILQYYESVDESATPSQIEAHALNLMTKHNEETKKLSINAIGNFEIQAGNGVYILINDINGEKIQQYGFLSECKHMVDHDKHMMSMEVIITGERSRKSYDTLRSDEMFPSKIGGKK